MRKSSKSRLVQLPLFEPASHWVPPLMLPDIKEDVIAIDLETCDPDLTSKGPGWSVKNGHVTGIAVATADRQWYLPIQHMHGDNIDKKMVLSWLGDITKHSKKTYIFHNAPYDLGWLSVLGITVKGNIVDTQVTESLLNEERLDGYSLDTISKEYLDRPKNEDLLRQAADAYGVDPKKEMYKLPARFVGPYAEMDARNTYDIYLKQKPRIIEQGLEKVFHLECRITPIIVEMTKRGIPVDVLKAEELNNEWKQQEKELRKSLGGVDIFSGQQLARLLTKHGIKYPRTEKGNPSIKKDWLAQHGDAHPILKQLRLARELAKIRSDFVDNAIIRGHTNGRVYPNFVQCAVDDGGTRTGRFASNNPNIQQVPKRSGDFDAKRIRALYIADEGYQWASLDYNAQEPRMQIHYGILKDYESAKEAKQYIETTGKKIYAFIEDRCEGITYNQAKGVALGRSYGMGKGKMAETIGISEDECGQVLEAFDRFCPYINQLAQRASDQAKRVGYIRTIYGRRRRFNFWTRSDLDWEERKSLVPIYDKATARREWNCQEKHLERAYTHKAFNALIQGSTADQTKQAIVDAYDAGYLPYSQVHDELNYPVSSEQDAKTIKDIMEHAVELKIQTVADLDLGEHW